MPIPEPLRTAIRTVLFRPGLRPRVLRGGALKGYRFLLDLRQDTQVWRGIWEQNLQAWLSANVRRGDVCLDIGAAEGHFTLQMAALTGSGGRVIAFEPSSRGDQIEQNLRINPERQLGRVDLVRAFAGRGGQPVDAQIDVPTLSVDAWLAENGVNCVNVVKIDVDGAEVEVLQGMLATLKKHKPHLSIEVHSPNLLAGVLKQVEPMGYQFKCVDPPPHELRPIPFNPTLYSLEPEERS